MTAFCFSLFIWHYIGLQLTSLPIWCGLFSIKILAMFDHDLGSRQSVNSFGRCVKVDIATGEETGPGDSTFWMQQVYKTKIHNISHKDTYYHISKLCGKEWSCIMFIHGHLPALHAPFVCTHRVTCCSCCCCCCYAIVGYVKYLLSTFGLYY